MQLKVNFIVARQCARRRTRPGKGCLKQAGRGGEGWIMQEDEGRGVGNRKRRVKKYRSNIFLVDLC